MEEERELLLGSEIRPPPPAKRATLVIGTAVINTHTHAVIQAGTA